MTNLVIRFLKWLPFVGLLLLAGGFALAIQNKHFDGVSGALSLLGVLFFLLIFARGESANVKFYVNVTLASALMLGIFVMIYLMVDSRNATWDLTKNRRFSLADQTVKYVKSLQTPIKLVGFYGNMTSVPAGAARDLLNRYSALNSKVTVEIIDPVQEILKVNLYKERFDTDIQPMSLFVENATPPKEGEKPRFKKVETLEEQGVTNAIIQVSQAKALTVYALKGHGEKTIESVAATKKNVAISDLKTRLVQAAMKVEPLQLTGFVPSDCDVLMVVGPTSDLLKPEADLLKDYLDKGGHALFFLDPPTQPGGGLANWAALLKGYGVELRPDVVLDYFALSRQLYTSVVAAKFDDYHEITKDATIQPFPMDVAVDIGKAANLPAGLAATELAMTGEMAWTEPVEQYMAEMQSMKINVPKKEMMKPHPLALAVSKTGDDAGTRLVVFADSDFISDDRISQPALTLTTLSIRWLQGQSDLVAIPPRSVEDTLMFLSAAEMSMIFIFVVVALPAAVFFGGLSYTMIRRRSR